jgi:flagellar biosynthesis/type III secretory pathway chaperone
MSTQETLQKHLQVCDELYQLALEENRHLKQHRRPADATLLERKRTLLEQLDQTLSSLRSANASGEAGRETRPLVEKLRSRILQILQLDKENEQLLLRASLSRGIEPAATPAPATALLQKIYGRTAP